jgi:hypothetical protein
MQKCLILFSILVVLLIAASLTGINEEKVDSPSVMIKDNNIEDSSRENVKEIDKILVKN